MDLALLIGAAVPMVGYYLSGTKNETEDQLRKEIPKGEKGNGDNIYNSTRYTEVDKYERGLVDNNWEASKNTSKTGIVPNFYNTMGPKVINSNPVRNTDINPIVNKPSRLRSDTGYDIKYTNTEIKEIPRDSRGFAQRGIEGFTVHGPQNSSNRMVHNNMVPFFKGQARQNMDPYAHQSTLERFTGQTGNVSENKAMAKEEIPNMFAPQKGLTYPYGTPNVGNYGRERYVTSELKTNIPAIPELRVGPGMDYGGPGVPGVSQGNYPSAPKDGFHPMYRPVDKNIDELRVNKKPTLPQRSVDGQKGSNRGVLGFVQKRTPDSFYLNGPDRYFTTTGDIQLPAIRENFAPDHTNRAETTTDYFGTGYGPDKVMGDFGVEGYSAINGMLQTERTGDYLIQSSGCAGDNGTDLAAGAQRTGVFTSGGSAVPVPIGRTRTTIKETTVRALEDYQGIAAPANSFSQTSKADYYNANITDRKEVTLQERRPGGHGNSGKNALGAESVVASQKYRESYDQSTRPNLGSKIYPTPTNYSEVGRQRFNPNTGLSEIAGIRQPESYLVQQFRNNPYTKSLTAAPGMTVRNCEPDNC